MANSAISSWIKMVWNRKLVYSISTISLVQELSSFYLDFNFFRSLLTIWKRIKWLTNPSKKACLFSVRSQRSWSSGGGPYSLVCKEELLLRFLSSPWLLGVQVRLHLRPTCWNVKCSVYIGRKWRQMDGGHLSTRSSVKLITSYH